MSSQQEKLLFSERLKQALTQANHPIAQEVFFFFFSDITDSSRDRIIISSFPISTETYKDSVLYKVAVAE